MFAVVRTGGKQYRVHPGDKIVVERLDGNAGDKITLGEVLLAGDAGKLKSTDGLTVAAEIVAQAKGEKVTVFKKRRRHNYRRKKGHRQQHTILKILAVGDQKAEKKAAPKPETAAAPAEASQKASAGKAAEKPAATAKSKAKGQDAAQKSGDVSGTPTENPAPATEEHANPPAQSVDAETKTPKTRSTKNAAPAKGGTKKAPKAK